MINAMSNPISGAAARAEAPQIPGVRLTGILGRGGFAIVYAGEQLSLQRPVAVKVDSRPLHDERNRRRFLREMSAASRISGHPHVVSLIDSGMLSDGRPYLVMERCDGGSLNEIMDRGPLPPADATRLVQAVASALGAAHSAGVLHRDLKPANILIDSYGAPRLSDFGIAAIQRAEAAATVTLDALTPAYAPPEAFNQAEPTAAGDVWSLGAVLFALVTGRGPRTTWDGRSYRLSQIIETLDMPVDTTDPRIPEKLRPILNKAMSKDPAQRYQDGNEFNLALATVLPGLIEVDNTVAGGPPPWRAVPSPSLSAPEPVAQPAASAPPGMPQPLAQPAYSQPSYSQPLVAAAQTTPPTAKQRRWPLVAAGIGGGALLVSIGFWGASLLGGKQTPAAQAPVATQTPVATAPPVAQPPVTQVPATAQPPTATQMQTKPPREDPAAAPTAAWTIDDDGLPHSDDMPYPIGTCMKGSVDDEGQSSSIQVACNQATWFVFAGGSISPDIDADSSEEAMGKDPQVLQICSVHYAELAGYKASGDYRIRVLGPLDREWDQGKRGFSCVFDKGE